MNMATVSRNLTSVKEAEIQLRHLNETLEQRVTGRTAELKHANARLRAEMVERERASAQLQEFRLELLHAARLSTTGHLAEALAHELNQPLTAIHNSVKAVRRLIVSGAEERTQTVLDILDEAAKQALRAGQIIRRLREFVTRGETDKRIEDVTAMIEEACALALTGPNLLGVDMQFSPVSGPTYVLANRTQIQQVLVNLIQNALEAIASCEHRAIHIGMSLLDHGLVEISVADTGSGLAADVVHRLFEPFVSTKQKGMGLGLSISRSIVEAHGGKIHAEPNPGGGTIFRFTIASSGEGASGDK
jgi:C4-dicarboxylate-specific signal transduction histidine kinase